MDLISREAVENIILQNKATHNTERIESDCVGNFERKYKEEAKMEEDDDIGHKITFLPSAFEGMTNDEVLSAVFPNGMQIFSKEWRNSPYKGVSE